MHGGRGKGEKLDEIIRLQCIFQQSLKRPLDVLESRSPFKSVAFLLEQARLSTPAHSVTG